MGKKPARKDMYGVRFGVICLILMFILRLGMAICYVSEELITELLNSWLKR